MAQCSHNTYTVGRQAAKLKGLLKNIVTPKMFKTEDTLAKSVAKSVFLHSIQTALAQASTRSSNASRQAR